MYIHKKCLEIFFYKEGSMQNSEDKKSFFKHKLIECARAILAICILLFFVIGIVFESKIEEYRADKEYNEIKKEVQQTILDLSTIKLKLPVDIGWSNGSNSDSSCFAPDESLHQISIEDIMFDARACIEYSNNDSLKNKASNVIAYGKKLEQRVFKFRYETEACFNATKKEYEETCMPILNGMKKSIDSAAIVFSKKAEEYFANRDENREKADLFKAYKEDNMNPYNTCYIPYKQIERFIPTQASYFKGKHPDLYKKYWKY